MTNITIPTQPVNPSNSEWFPIALNIGESDGFMMLPVAGQKHISDQGTEYIMETLMMLGFVAIQDGKILLNVPLYDFADLVNYGNTILSPFGSCVTFDQWGHA